VNCDIIKVRFQKSICFVQIDRSEAHNTINGQLIAECTDVLSKCEESATIAVLSGSSELFSDTSNAAAVARYVEHGAFPWERT